MTSNHQPSVTKWAAKMWVLTLLGLLLGITEVKAELSISSMSAALSDKQINALSMFTIQAQFSAGGSVQVNDCIEIIRPSPYSDAAETYAESTLKNTKPFYQTFPADITYSLSSSSHPATIERLSESRLKITITGLGTDNTQFNFKINSMKVPFSQIVSSTDLEFPSPTNIKILHKQQCLGTVTSYGTNSNHQVPLVVDTYSIPDTSTLNKPSSIIQPQSGTANILASSNGKFIITMTPGDEFPVYGGKILITVPLWYSGTSGVPAVFNIIQSGPTNCDSAQIDIKTKSNSGTEYTIQFRSYSGASPIVIECTNYNNPIFRQTVTGFSIKVLDNEANPNLIANYPAWSMDVFDLQAVPLKAPDFQFYRENSDLPSSPTPIQSSVGISIELQMGQVPVDNTGCYIKYTFPDDFELPSRSLFYQGYDILSTPTGASILPPSGANQQVYTSMQAKADGNTIVVKGCLGPTGKNKIPKVKISLVMTPFAAKDTKEFDIQMYKTYDDSTNKFDNLIAETKAKIPASAFTSGKIEPGNENFEGFIKFIQTRAAHNLEFTLKNSFPAKNSMYDSRIVIGMPERMTWDANFNGADVKSLDGLVMNPVIERETSFTGCAEPRVCYSIKHSNFNDILPGFKIRFQIQGTKNQESVVDAGKWFVQTQIFDANGFYNIDRGDFASNFLTEKGGVSLTQGKATTSSNYETFFSGSVYTFKITLGYYIPSGGSLVIYMPSGITVPQTPFTDFKSPDDNNLVADTYNSSSVTLKANDRIPASDLTIEIGGIQNPRSLEPTSVFQVATFDKNGNVVCQGSLDNIMMTSPGKFNELIVQPQNMTNGAMTKYEIRFTTTVPVSNKDLFYLAFPASIKTPKDPQCEKGLCLDYVTCTSEKGKIIVTLNNPCTAPGSVISFFIDDIQNSPSMVPSLPLGAYITTKKYARSSEYGGILKITNTNSAFFDNSTNSVHQVIKEFEEESQYTLRVTPRNPVPKWGWIQVTYPVTVSIADAQKFIQGCQIFTSTSFSGAQYCMHQPEKRQVWIMNVFQDQDSYTSEIAIYLNFTNPVNNTFDKSVSESDQAFHITTYDFDTNNVEFSALKTNYASNVAAFIAKVKLNPTEYAKQIDTVYGNWMKPLLKCKSPCYKCLDSDPYYCTACWGPGKKNEWKSIFLQTSEGTSNCTDSCKDKYTVNGNSVEMTNNRGEEDPTKTYNQCEDCDITCGTCKGQKEVGKKGDKVRCETCSRSFPYFVPTQEACLTTCGAGYFTFVDFMPVVDNFQGECGICQKPCSTCRRCDPSKDKNCKGSSYDTFASYCTACNQEDFFPEEYDDISDIQTFVTQQAAIKNSALLPLSAASKNVINNNFEGLDVKKFMKLKVESYPLEFRQSMGLATIENIDINSTTTFKDYYVQAWKDYQFPNQSLHENQCLAFCPDKFASVNGICRACQGPCNTCKKDVTRCTSCLQTPDNDKKYHFGRSCFEECPPQTVTDEKNKRCLGCISGCLVCKLEDQELCEVCMPPLLLYNQTCVGACPQGFRENFEGTVCEPAGELPIIYFPCMILLFLALIIAIGGKFSSKNVYGQHRVLLSFYAMGGIADGLAIWAQLLFTLLQGELWHLAIPGTALFANYYLNMLYTRLWNELDPPKPKNEEQLFLKEVKLINKCDRHFDNWNGKYQNIAQNVKRVVMFFSHKFFQMPYTHFFGYLHCTVRIQDDLAVWQWDIGDWQRFVNKKISVEKVKKKTYRFKGRLVTKKIDPEEEAQKDRGSGKFNPMLYVQSPLAEGHTIKDLRIYKMFVTQMKIDFLFIRFVLIAGNLFLLATDYIKREPFQLMIQAAESVLISIIMMYLQTNIVKNWEDHKLPFKMKDTKANYLFKELRLPNELKKIEEYLNADHDQEFMPGWDKYLPYYKFPEIFLDNKLEELLNIFGRRQCKSCIEFPTGTELVEDERKVRSFPLSPRGEELYKGRQGDFDIIDFQLLDNVYNEAHEQPSQMFTSMARDFSDFGAQVFAFDVMNALNRKGGNLLTPGIDDTVGYRRQQRKKRGRKNKYYKQIDQEDDDEANQVSGDSDNDGLDQVKEADDEDDEEEIMKKRMQIEAARQEARKKAEAEAEKLRKEKAQQDLQNELESQLVLKKKKEQEEKDRKAKEEEERRILAEEEERQKKEKERKDAKEKEMREVEERIAKEQAEKDKKARAMAEAEALKKAKEEEEYKDDIVKHHSPQKQSKKALEEDDKASNFSMLVQENAMNNFQSQKDQQIVEVPPTAESRKFNECDIIGTLGRDEKGNVVLGAEDPKTGLFKDSSGNPTNQRGYLIDPKTGDIINNHNNQKMFDKKDLDERGEVPAPFNLEKHNFNPHAVRGEFDFDRNGKAVVVKNKDGSFSDKRGSKVSSRGYRLGSDGSVVDNNGRKKFDKAHMTQDGDLPKLFNYNGRRFDIVDTLGQVDKDKNGNIVPHADKKGNLVDNTGRRINNKGYLIDEFGNVVDKDGRQIFENKHLENQEIPKIFPFTKFNVKNVLGEFEMDPLGIPILDKDKNGNYVDNQKRRVNSKGYLIDTQGNVIDKNGKVTFKKKLLDNEDDIPKVFRTGLLKSDTASSLSRLMSEIERNQPSEFDKEEQRIQQEINNQLKRPKRGNSGNTSVDSMMEDTPANYNDQNQRYDPAKDGKEGKRDKGMRSGDDMEDYDMEDDDYGSQYEQQMGLTGVPAAGEQLLAKKRRKKKKKTKKRRPADYEDPSLREVLLAGAYGGVAKQKVKREGVKYTTDIDAGLRDLVTPGILHHNDSRRNINAIQGLGHGSGDGHDSSRKHRGRRMGGNMSDTSSRIGGGSQSRHHNISASKILDPQQREQHLKEKQMDEIKRKEIARAAAKRKAAQKAGKVPKDADFEKMFGKDIDEFLEDSEWDIESMDKMSQFSKGSKNTNNSANASKLRGLEKVYLQRLEGNQKTPGAQNALQMTGSHISGARKQGGKKFRDGEDEGDRKKAWDAGSRQSSKNRSVPRGIGNK